MKMPSKTRSMLIQAKLSYGIGSAAAGAGLAIMLAFAVNDITTMRRNLFDNLSGSAAMLGANSAAAISSGDGQAAAGILAALRAKPWVVAARLHLPDGGMFAEYKTRHCGFSGNRQEVPVRGEARFSKDGFAHLVQPIVLDGETIASIHLVSDLSELQAKARHRLLIMAGILFVAIATGATLAVLVVKRIVFKPVLRLMGTMSAVKKDENYALRAEKSSDDELGALVDGFNEMLSWIEAHDAERRQYSERLEDEVAARTGEMRLAMEEAQAASRAKSQFLANMSHEIRTPINGVSGMLQLLQGTPVDKRQRHYIKTASTAVKTLLKVINDVLDFSKGDAGKMELDAVDFNLRELTEDVLQLFSEMAAEKEIELACIIDPEVPLALRGDDRRIVQVLMNLVGNAIKFTECGDILLRVGMERSGGEKTNLRFSLSDTGMGIPEELQKNLFRPFSQADESMTRKYGGTGLGLAICSQLVHLMGGEIGVDSEEGTGSTFWFTVVIEKQAVQDSGNIPMQLPGLRVLVVDDNGMSRDLLCRQLVSWGCSVEGLASGAEAFPRMRAAHAAGKTFDVALIDEGMPEMPGSRLIGKIMADPDLGDTQLVLLCPLLSQTVSAGGFQLQKPVRQAELYDMLAGSQLVVEQETDSPEWPQVDSGIKILVAEDNEINQMVVVEMVTVFGCRHECVANGKEAVAAIKGGDYDLVLMDCQMPVMDGYEAARAIREWEAAGNHGRIPVVALTAHAMKGDREACMNAGMDDYLTKPVDQEELLRCLHKWIEQPRCRMDSCARDG
ncbi:MAG: response regulator [Verrucomicrobiota bacterium]